MKELRTLINANFDKNSELNFNDVESATRNAIINEFGLEDLSPRQIKQHRNTIMALIEEAIDAALPKALENRIGDFAEVKSFARDEEVVFKLKNRGKRRAWLTIKKGARGGLYQAARLDSDNFQLETWTETVAVFITLEEYLLGKYSLVDLMDNILDGFVERLYVQVIEALQAVVGDVPGANKANANNIDKAKLNEIIAVVAQYGSPVIVGFRSVISKIDNVTPYTSAYPSVSVKDVEDYRSKGYVSEYLGTPIVLLPNYITDENTNASWLLNEEYLFILPAGVKPVKVALRGDLHIQDVAHPSGSFEQHAHKMIGVGIAIKNNIGLYKDDKINE